MRVDLFAILLVAAGGWAQSSVSSSDGAVASEADSVDTVATTDLSSDAAATTADEDEFPVDDSDLATDDTTDDVEATTEEDYTEETTEDDDTVSATTAADEEEAQTTTPVGEPLSIKDTTNHWGYFVRDCDDSSDDTCCQGANLQVEDEVFNLTTNLGTVFNISDGYFDSYKWVVRFQEGSGLKRNLYLGSLEVPDQLDALYYTCSTSNADDAETSTDTGDDDLETSTDSVDDDQATTAAEDSSETSVAAEKREAVRRDINMQRYPMLAGDYGVRRRRLVQQRQVQTTADAQTGTGATTATATATATQSVAPELTTEAAVAPTTTEDAASTEELDVSGEQSTAAADEVDGEEESGEVPSIEVGKAPNCTALGNYTMLQAVVANNNNGPKTVVSINTILSKRPWGYAATNFKGRKSYREATEGTCAAIQEGPSIEVKSLSYNATGYYVPTLEPNATAYSALWAQNSGQRLALVTVDEIGDNLNASGKVYNESGHYEWSNGTCTWSECGYDCLFDIFSSRYLGFLGNGRLDKVLGTNSSNARDRWHSFYLGSSVLTDSGLSLPGLVGFDKATGSLALWATYKNATDASLLHFDQFKYEVPSLDTFLPPEICEGAEYFL